MKLNYKKKNYKKSISIISFMISLSIVILFLINMGCSNHSPQKYMQTNKEKLQQDIINKTQVVNPATLYCMNTTDASWSIRKTKASEYGICTFSDQSWCEEWAYYNKECLPGMNMTTCDGKFWGKAYCPTVYEPVCATMAEIDLINNKTIRTEQKTFNNACSACTYSKESMKSLGYVLGKC